jgi:NADH:ubiquinone oxidoreductase subunit 3 (subunit A)
MGGIMRRIIFLVVAIIFVRVILLLWFLISNKEALEVSIKAPLERGFFTTGEIINIFSIQLFAILILFLILDLEIVFIISFIFSLFNRLTVGLVFILLIGARF